MEKRNTLLLTVIAVATLLVAVVGATFAYFASSITPGEGLNLDVTAEASTAQFAATGTTFQMTVTPDLMQQGSSANNPVAKSTTGTFTVSLGTEAAAVTCTYNIKFKWTNGSSYTPTTGLYDAQGAAAVNGGKEFTVKAALATNSQVTTGENSIVEEVNLDKLVNEGVVISGATIAVDAATKTAEAVWTFTTNFYNLSLNQSALAGEGSKTYTGNFYADNVVC